MKYISIKGCVKSKDKEIVELIKPYAVFRIKCVKSEDKEIDDNDFWNKFIGFLDSNNWYFIGYSSEEEEK